MTIVGKTEVFKKEYSPMLYSDQQAQGLRPGWVTGEVLSPGWFTQFPDMEAPPGPGTQQDYSHQFRSLGVCEEPGCNRTKHCSGYWRGTQIPWATWCPFLDQQEELWKLLFLQTIADWEKCPRRQTIADIPSHRIQFWLNKLRDL